MKSIQLGREFIHVDALEYLIADKASTHFQHIGHVSLGEILHIVPVHVLRELCAFRHVHGRLVDDHQCTDHHGWRRHTLRLTPGNRHKRRIWLFFVLGRKKGIKD
jgi:hypothetical protein